MQCPKCNAKTKVIRTYASPPHDVRTIRLRQCKECGFEGISTELYYDENGNTVNGLSASGKVQVSTAY